jgi:hypothetical protein
VFRSTILVATALCTLATFGQAQADSTRLTAGMKLRVHQQRTAPIVGTLISLDPEHVVLLLSPADTAVLSRQSITKVELYQGTRSGAGKGAVTGLLIGATIGAIGGAISASATEGSYVEYSAGEGALAYGVTLGLLGTGIGALVGSGSHHEIWQPTVLPTVSMQPGGQGGKRVAMGLRISF